MSSNIEKLAAEVVIPGVPRVLSYSFSPENIDVQIGSEVTVEVGRRQTFGWVVNRIPLKQAVDNLRALDSKITSQLSLLPAQSTISQIKPIRSVLPAFLPEQLELFKWMAEYYGTTLVDVIENAVPKRYKVSRKKQIAQIAEYVRDANFCLADTTAPELTAAQKSALQTLRTSLDSHKFSTTLLFGVTGSGKTEVYLSAIEKVLAEGGSALLIVPEIALTPQLFDQFAARLKIRPALLHSQVAGATRWATWEAMLKGEIRIAIGARSAVFAPLKNLRLIVVDEEHESSYKQSDGLRYHARDVAVMRGKFSNSTVILGSATPSFESLHNAANNRYSLIQLPERVSERPLPAIEIVDLNQVRRGEMPSDNISPQFHRAIVDTLANKGQIVILYNRRGFSSYLQCGSCNEVLLCPHCSVALTFHKKRGKLLCHYCGESINPPTHCRICRDEKTTQVEKTASKKELEKAEKFGLLETRGAGTEKVVDELYQLFPQAKIVRLDRDSVEDRDSYRKILGSMRTGEADILVGTQMIAKGHDLPGVTLVGIVDADVGLHAPDFRSSEKTFQLITQAAGRAGRGSEPGRVIVQTREPQHPTILAVATGRFKAFARYELDYRKKLHYPPSGRLLRLIISSPDQQDAFMAAQFTREAVDKIVGHLKTPVNETEANLAIKILGPALAPHERLRGRYRWHILIKAPSASVVSELAGHLARWRSQPQGFKDFRLAIDVDPLDML